AARAGGRTAAAEGVRAAGRVRGADGAGRIVAVRLEHRVVFTIGEIADDVAAAAVHVGADDQAELHGFAVTDIAVRQLEHGRVGGAATGDFGPHVADAVIVVVVLVEAVL